jgi:hypothetical protein
MLDYRTVEDVKRFINKQIAKIKDDLCYGIDTMEKLHYSRGQIRALEALLQDLNDLLKKENDDDDDDSGDSFKS